MQDFGLLLGKYAHEVDSAVMSKSLITKDSKFKRLTLKNIDTIHLQ